MGYSKLYDYGKMEEDELTGKEYGMFKLRGKECGMLSRAGRVLLASADLQGKRHLI